MSLSSAPSTRETADWPSSPDARYNVGSMNAPDDPVPLAAGFAPPDIQAWRALVAKIVPGGEEALVRRTHDGIAVRPLYRRIDAPDDDTRPGAPPFARGATPDGPVHRPWRVCQRVAHPDPLEAGREIREEIAGGSDAILLGSDEHMALGADRLSGTALYDVEDVAALLDGVPLDKATLVLDAGWRFGAVAALLLAWAERRGLAPERVPFEMQGDPLGAAARGIAIDLDAAQARAVEITCWLDGRGAVGPALLADGAPYHGGGASAAHELGCALATATAYLRALDAAGLPPERAAPRIGFRLAIDTDVLAGIAKLRAMRRLWHRVTEACGATARDMRLAAITAERMISRRDPRTNVLRGTVACFAAAVGGADTITVLPLDHALGLPTPEARRLARTTQLVLREESHLHRVIDPAGGSGAVEAATLALAREGWSVFQLVESGGGMGQMLTRGSIQEWIANTWDERERHIRRCEVGLVGISVFPEPEAASVSPATVDTAPLIRSARERIASSFDTRGVALDTVLALAREGRAPVFRGPTATYTPVVQHRLAEPFESLCDRSAAIAERTGETAVVVVVRLRSAAREAERAAWVRHAFAAGGIATREVTAEATEWASAQGRVAVLVGDAAPKAAEGVVAGLLAAGALEVWWAGKAEPLDPGLASIGVARVLRPGDDLASPLESVLTAYEERASAGGFR